MLVVIPLLVGVSLFDLFLRKGYKVKFDDQGVYWRKVGLRRAPGSFQFLPFDQIEMVGASAGNPSFEVIRIGPRLGGDEEILLSRDYLRDEEIAKLLQHIKSRSVASFDEATAEFLQTM